MQRTGNYYVYRQFRAFIYDNPKENKMPIKYKETKRTLLCPECINNMQDISAPILCFDKDGIEDSPFKYTVKYIEEGIRKNREYLLNNNEHWECRDNYYMGAACGIVFCPAYEKLVNLFKGNNKICSTLLAEMPNYHGSLMSFLNERFGELNFTEDEVHKIIGISKSALDVFKEGGYYLYELKAFKAAFEYEKDYMMNMSGEDAKKILDSLYLSNMSIDLYFSKILKILVKMYGVNDFTNYIKFLCREYKYGKKIEDYYDYIKVCDEVKENNAVIPKWQIRQCELEKAKEILLETQSKN